MEDRESILLPEDDDMFPYYRQVGRQVGQTIRDSGRTINVHVGTPTASRREIRSQLTTLFFANTERWDEEKAYEHATHESDHNSRERPGREGSFSAWKRVDKENPENVEEGSAYWAHGLRKPQEMKDLLNGPGRPGGEDRAVGAFCDYLIRAGNGDLGFTEREYRYLAYLYGYQIELFDFEREKRGIIVI